MKTKIYIFLSLLLSAYSLRAQQALDLGGTSNQVTIPYSVNTTNFTVEFDFKMNALQNYNAGVTGTSAHLPAPIDFYIPSNGVVNVLVGNGSSFNGYTGSTLSAGQWYHIAMVVTTSPSKTLKVYVDGIAVINTTFTVNLSSTGTLRIGDRSNNDTNANAVFDNVRVWSIARTAQEIADNDTVCLTGSETGLDVYYNFEDITSTTVEDYATANGQQNGNIVGSYSLVTGGGCTPTVVAPTTDYSTQVYTGDDKTLSNVSVTGSNIKWYTAASGGSLLPISTALVNETTYYASQKNLGVESARTSIKVNRISDNSQSLISGNAISNLVSSPSSGTTASWYTASSGGSALSSGTLLNATNYYVQQEVAAGITVLNNDATAAPSDVVVQSDGKIVWSTLNGKIKRMDADGSNVVTLVSSGLNNPYGIALQSDGKILIADTYNGAIKRVDTDGTNMVTLWTQGGSFPFDVTVQADGKIVWGGLNNVVYRMDADGTNVTTLVTSGLSSVRGVAVLSDGKILIVNNNSQKVVRVDADGTNMIDFITGYTPNKVYQLSDGKIVVGDQTNQQFKKYNSDGTFVASIASSSYPFAVAQESNGSVITAEVYNYNVGRIVSASNGNRVPVVVDVTLGNETIDSTSVGVYPNPSNGIFNVVVKENANVQVIDFSGKVIVNQTVKAGESSMNISSVGTGVYFLKVTTEKGNVIYKIFKQ